MLRGRYGKGFPGKQSQFRDKAAQWGSGCLPEHNAARTSKLVLEDCGSAGYGAGLSTKRLLLPHLLVIHLVVQSMWIVCVLLIESICILGGSAACVVQAV